jgi:hypothetical protein
VDSHCTRRRWNDVLRQDLLQAIGIDRLDIE